MKKILNSKFIAFYRTLKVRTIGLQGFQEQFSYQDASTTMKTFFDGNCGPIGLICEVAVVKTSRSRMGLGNATICSMAQGMPVHSQPLSRPDGLKA